MQAAGFGRIVNITSEAARLGSKGGAVLFGRQGWRDRVHEEPGARECALRHHGKLHRAGADPHADAGAGGRNRRRAAAAAMTEATLLRRLGEPDEVASAALFLASTRPGYITGETLGVSGGMGLGG